MAVYGCSCEKCGPKIDGRQKMNAPAPGKCEMCGAEGTMPRQVSRTSFVLRGGGWYSDLYGSAKKDSGGTGAPASTSTSSTAPATSTDTPKKDPGSGTSGGSSGTGSPPPASGTPSSSGGSGSGGSRASPA